jgi:hypothetical protein
MPSGAKSTFSPAKASIAIHLRAEGAKLKEICAQIGITVGTLSTWLSDNPDFLSQFSRASQEGYDLLAEELLEIPDTYEDINRGRLKSDNIKWILARRAASKYGDKVTLDINQTVSIGAALSEALARVAVQGDDTKPQAIDITSEVIERDTDLKSVDQAKSTTIEDIL